MPKVSPLQSNFSSGEVSPFLGGRVDLDRYKTSLKTCQNYVPTIQGPLFRRPGTMFVFPTKDNGVARLQAFEFSITQAYNLEFGNQYIRFFKDNAIITATEQNVSSITKANPAVVTYVGSDTYANGDRVTINGVLGMTQVNNREFTVANVNTGANTFELSGVNSTGYDTYTSGGTVAEITEISSPYLVADVFQLKFTQSADVLYIVHPDYAPRKLVRTSHTSWTLSAIDFLDGPYLSTNTTTTTLTPSAATGTGVTLTASAVTGINNDTGFQTSDVGRLIRIKEGTTWGYVKITGYTSTTVVTVTVVNTLTNTSAKTSFRMGLFSSTTGYPSCVTFHEDRLGFAGSLGALQRQDLSKSGDYENFAPTGTDGVIAADNALAFSFNSNDVNAIRWMVSDEKGLLSGTLAGEWVTRPSSQSEALSPTNITAKKSTAWGSEDIQPVQGGKGILFVQRAGRKIRELNYFFDVDGFRAADITQLAEHISQSGLVQIAYQKEPQGLVWAVRNDGVLASCTYDRDLDAVRIGWARHIIGGYSDAAGSDAIVESVQVLPSADGQRQDVWIIVKRYINGGVKRYIEYITKFFEDTDDAQDAFFVDGGLNYDVPVTISGATKANPCVVTATSHGFSNGDKILITDVLGMAELNGNTYLVAGAAANTFQLHNLDGDLIDSTAFTTYVSGGEVRKLVQTISGLFHLEGQSVSILGDGAVHPNATVTLGKITLDQKAATIQIGLGYSSKGQLLRLEAGAADGTALGKTRRTHRVGMLLHRTLGLKIGYGFDDLNTITFRSTSDPLTRAVPLFSGIISETVESDYDFENEFCWQQDQPLPGAILAIMPQMVTQDRG